MSGNWTWSCTGCGAVFHGDTAEEAQGKFLDHANARHAKATILSVNTANEIEVRS